MSINLYVYVNFNDVYVAPPICIRCHMHARIHCQIDVYVVMGLYVYVVIYMHIYVVSFNVYVNFNDVYVAPPNCIRCHMHPRIHCQFDVYVVMGFNVYVVYIHPRLRRLMQRVRHHVHVYVV